MVKIFENDTDLHLLFVDFRPAFDRIDEKKAIAPRNSQKLVNLTEMTMKNFKESVMVEGKGSRDFIPRELSPA